jgi:hypothetical protein
MGLLYLYLFTPYELSWIDRWQTASDQHEIEVMYEGIIFVLLSVQKSISSNPHGFCYDSLTADLGYLMCPPPPSRE